MPHTIVVVDDHILIAKAISGIIDHFKQFNVLYECENGKRLMEKFKVPNNLPDIVLLDISMPEMDGFDTARWLQEHYPAVIVVALSMQDDDESLVKMVKAGAKGYLHKNVHPAELEKALETVLSRGMYFPDWATSRIFSKMASPDQPGSYKNIPLTEREKEFLQYACTELTYKEIGEKMFCSPRTVESYRDALFEKLHVKTRVALALFAVKAKLVEL